MATISFKNGDEYIAKLSKLAANTKADVIGPALYGAADMVTDEIRAQLRKVPADESWGTPEEKTKGPSKAQKKGLDESLGIASMQDDGTGFLNVKVGFDGYNSIKTKTWPKGQPNQLVARSVERGTSFMRANPFVKKAMSAVTKKAVAHMKETVDEKIEKIMEGK